MTSAPTGLVGNSPQWAPLQAGLADRLASHLNPEDLAQTEAGRQALGRLWQAMRHGVLNGGKRARGLLVMASAQAVGADPLRPEVLDLACALECIHAFSLVHDDMPCMDDDDLRRGQPTVHVAFDEATALLVGDALQTLGLELVLAGGQSRGGHSNDVFVPAQRLEMARVLARATGARGMAGGQAIDIQMVGQPMSQSALEEMHSLKTGALIQAAVALGGLATWPVPPEWQSALAGYAQSLGLAFQVVDDLLDAQADTEALGKTAGKDEAQNKPTFVSLLGLEESRRYADHLHSEALAHLSVFGLRAEPLRELAVALTHRSH